jgi:hypothetical protein
MQVTYWKGFKMKSQEKPKIKQPPIMFKKTQKLIYKISEQLGWPLITYWNNHRGCVCQSDVVALYEILGKVGKQKTLFIFIKSDGGYVEVSLRLVSLLRQYCQRLVALAPLECASAATMIALGANEIQMGPIGYLTSIDTALTHDLSPLDRDNDRVRVSLDELNRVLRLWRTEQAGSKENPYKILYEYVHPLVIGAVDRAESLSIMLCKAVLANHITDAAIADQIANTLNSQYPSHSYPILLEEAHKIGLSVSPLIPSINSSLLTLNEYYSEEGQKSTTDFNEHRSHSNEILNIWESEGIQVYYQQDKDWFYRAEERRWISMNDHSNWRRIEKIDGEVHRNLLHIS